MQPKAIDGRQTAYFACLVDRMCMPAHLDRIVQSAPAQGIRFIGFRGRVGLAQCLRQRRWPEGPGTVRMSRNHSEPALRSSQRLRERFVGRCDQRIGLGLVGRRIVERAHDQAVASDLDVHRIGMPDHRRWHRHAGERSPGVRCGWQRARSDPRTLRASHRSPALILQRRRPRGRRGDARADARAPVPQRRDEFRGESAGTSAPGSISVKCI